LLSSDGESNYNASASKKKTIISDLSDDEDGAGEAQSADDTAQFMRTIGWLGSGDSLDMDGSAASGSGDASKRKHRRSKSRDEDAASRLKARKKPGAPKRNKNNQTYPPPKSKFTQFDYAAAANQPTLAATCTCVLGTVRDCDQVLVLTDWILSDVAQQQQREQQGGAGGESYTPSVSAPASQRSRGQARTKSGQRSQSFRGGPSSVCIDTLTTRDKSVLFWC
jgi:hypothetical protein